MKCESTEVKYGRPAVAATNKQNKLREHIHRTNIYTQKDRAGVERKYGRIRCNSAPSSAYPIVSSAVVELRESL